MIYELGRAFMYLLCVCVRAPLVCPLCASFVGEFRRVRVQGSHRVCPGFGVRSHAPTYKLRCERQQVKMRVHELTINSAIQLLISGIKWKIPIIYSYYYKIW